MSQLPDMDNLRQAYRGAWREFGLRLRAAGFGVNYLEPRVSSNAYEAAVYRALQVWQARRKQDSLAQAHRLLVLRDPLRMTEARQVLGRGLLRELLRVGVLTSPSDDEVVGAFDLRVFRGLLVLCDDLSHGGDAVFGVGPGSAAFHLPVEKPAQWRRGLELGCGAGAVALWLATQLSHVVATDINPRALDLIRINAELNGISNIETREGDLFTAVRGESFDFITSQPPYVPHVPGSPAATYLHGGPNGSETVERVVCELPTYLAKNGRALVVFDHVTREHADGIAFDPEMRTTLILGSDVDPDVYCLRQRMPGLLPGSDAFARAVMEFREHLHAVNITAVCPAICIVEHAGAYPPRNDVLRAGMTLWNEVSSTVLDKLFQACDARRVAQGVWNEPAAASPS